ncbi:MAG: hypothetical protein KIT84_10260 [Labilithrix sp.]|nr:hypothetical protein [Labilithrix sp.]MCW5811387.1 hypothetical protein [Labilithrix sp.]
MRSAFTFPLVAVAAIGVTSVVVACSDSEARACRVGADCASGVCSADGRCVPVQDGGVFDAGAPPADDDDDDDDEVIKRPSDDGGGLTTRGCVANRDGVIAANEVPTRAGLHGIFRFATKALVSTEGTDIGGGKRRWDLSGKLNGDANVLIETLPLDDKWYGPKFPNGSYATPIGKSPDLLAVFAKSDDGSLTILGAVSSYDGAYRTELINDKAVEVLKFPLEKGKKWESSVINVTGVAPYPTAPTSPSGPYAYTDVYENEVDGEGELVAPLGTFDVLRVRILITRTFPAVPPAVPTETVVKTRQFAFVTECYGNVAAVTSELNEPNVEFTNAAEVRRIAP